MVLDSHSPCTRQDITAVVLITETFLKAKSRYCYKSTILRLFYWISCETSRLSIKTKRYMMKATNILKLDKEKEVGFESFTHIVSRWSLATL